MKKKTFEEHLAQLKKTVEALQQENISLEEAITNYQQGKEEYQHCRQILEDAKQKIEVCRKEE